MLIVQDHAKTSVHNIALCQFKAGGRGLIIAQVFVLEKIRGHFDGS